MPNLDVIIFLSWKCEKFAVYHFRVTNCSNFKDFWELYPYSYILCIVSNFRYTCNNNFKIKGTVSDTQATIQCQSDSTWGTLPECVSK